MDRVEHDQENDDVINVSSSDRVEILRRDGFAFVHLPPDVDWTDVNWQKQKELRELFVNPGFTIFFSPERTETLERFFKDYPAHSIALDGFVPGLYHFQTEDDGGPRVVIDHHMSLRDLGVEHLEIDRTIVRSACEQIFRRVGNGFFRKHFGVGEHMNLNLNVFVNDLDEDVLLSLYRLYRLVHPHGDNGTKQKSRLRAFFRLVNHEGLKDADGGSFSFGGEGFEGPDPYEEDERLKWTFLPCSEWKHNPTFRQYSHKGLCGAVIDETFERIDAYLDGRAKRIPLDGGYEVLFDDPTYGWCLVTEHGHEARMRMAEDGVGAIISHIRRGTRGDVFTLWKIDDASSWPVTELYEAFNRLERLRVQIQETLRKELTNCSIDEHFTIADELLNMNERDERLDKTHQQGVGMWGGSERGGGSPREGTWMWKELIAALTHVYIDQHRKDKGHVSSNLIEDKERKEGGKLFKPVDGDGT